MANTVSEITVDDECYHVARALPGQQLFVRIYWDRLEVLDTFGEQWLATLPRIYLPRREQAIDWATELRPFLNKPRAVEHATYLKALPAVIRGFVTTADRAERTARLQTLIDLFDAGHSVSVVAEAVRTALETSRGEIGRV